MRLSWVIILFSFAASGMAAADNCNHAATEYFLYDTTPQAKNAGVDYPKELDAAFGKDRKALLALFNLSAAGVLDGAGSQSHANVLWDLLHCWGDQSFGQVLAEQDQQVIDAVLRNLDYESIAGETQYSEKFPRTYALGKHVQYDL